jgi:protoporphyrin/coproporphyrin ferrochelatase
MNHAPYDDQFNAAHGRSSHPSRNHPNVKTGQIGVLIVNLGTPDGVGYWPMRRYLKEFLSDRRVIEVNQVLWSLLLNLVILTTRPSASGKAYAHIWNREHDESPLRTVTRSQTNKLADAFANQPQIIVDWAMRYGSPSIHSRLESLAEQGCERILLFPLYPQYSASTTASVCDCAFDALKQMRRQPTLRVAPPYYANPHYIEALANSMRDSLAALDFEPQTVLASFHGLPQSYFDKGDPYYCHCAKTVRLLREVLGWDENRLLLTFQSRFGKAEWIKPYTDATLIQLAEQGVKRVAVITPGFAADCLETLEEIAIRAAETFRQHGGESFAAIPCLNDSPDAIDLFAQIIHRELQGWIF